MKISLFTSKFDNEPQEQILDTWEDFVEQLGPHDFSYQDKEEAPLFSPAEWPKGELRSKDGVFRVHFGVLDLDGITPDDIERLSPLLDGMAYLFYTTWSHATKYAPKGQIGARLCFPFSRPVMATEWPRFFPKMRAFFLGLPDKACSDASRVFFPPSSPAGTEGDVIYLTGEGKPLDVDALIASAPAIMYAPIDIAEFVDWSRRVRGQWLKPKLDALLAGDALAGVGDRDNTVFRLVAHIVERFPEATPESIAALFESSLREMDFEVDVAAKVRAHQKKTGTDKVQAAQSRIRVAFNNGREHPYTDEEAQKFGDMSFKWLVQKDQSYYVFIDGRYEGPFSQHSADNAAQIYLSPATSLGVDTIKILKTGGTANKTLKELVYEYGQQAADIVVDLSAQCSRYDQATRTLYEAPCPRRPMEPEWSDVVDRWLQLACGQKYDVVQDWLAVVGLLDKPCAALYLEGRKNTGKSLFAEGIARMWTTNGPTDLADVLGTDFNSKLLGCPIVFADESMPANYRTGDLRRFIQARSRTLKRKFLADATVHGAVRLVLAANNGFMLNTGEHLTQNDIEAIVDRVVHVEVQDDAVAYLQSLPEHVRHGLVAGDAIARHALYLTKSRNVGPSHRFLVASDRTKLHQSLTTGTGLRSAVCHWLVSYLLNPRKVDSTRKLLVRIEEGVLLATSRGLAEDWEMYPTNVDPPPAGVLGRAISELSKGKQRYLQAGDGRRTWYYPIDTDHLVSWSHDNGFADADTIRACLSQETRQTGAVVPLRKQS